MLSVGINHIPAALKFSETCSPPIEFILMRVNKHQSDFIRTDCLWIEKIYTFITSLIKTEIRKSSQKDNMRDACLKNKGC